MLLRFRVLCLHVLTYENDWQDLSPCRVHDDLRFRVLCFHVRTYAYERQDISQSRFHFLFTQILGVKALGEQTVETVIASIWCAMLS